MAIIKKFSSLENLSRFGVFLNDTNPNSTYFRITELGENLTGGKNGFLIEGSECLKETTEIKIEVLDVNGNPIYFELGSGVPQYYEGLSKVVGIYVYEDTPIGLGKVTILGELKSYFDNDGNKIDVPDDWKGIYNVKWEKQLNINRNLANETRVRFFKRPNISIEEISKPLFTKTIPTITQSGSLDGIPLQPEAGTNYSNYGGGVLYRLKVNSGPNFTSSIDENTILFPSLNYNPTVKEALSETEVLVDSAYTGSDGLVAGFTNVGYTSSFDNEEGITVTESALTGSFAKIKITNLKTFVGDVARIKVFRKSRNETGDFTLVQEQKLESTELLKDVTTAADTELSYGIFNNYNLSNYWITSSATHPVTLDNTQLLNSVKVDYGGSGTQLIYTSESLDIGNDIEYNLSFKTKLSGSASTSKQIHAYLSGSEFTQSIVIVSGSNDTLQKFDVNKNIISTNSGSARLVLETTGDDWYISNVSFRNAEETSFSPDEFTLVQEVPRKLDSEFFDFKFEFYDINNNFIPVEVKKSKNFSGGNLTTTSNVRLLEFETDRTAFRFSSGSLGNPPFQQSRFKVTSNGLTGSITFASAAFDKNGTFIDPSSYSGAYPGALNTNNVLTIASFSGSDASVIVGSITYTASIEDKEEIETITRFEDGEPASALIVTSNQNQFFYKATDLSVEPSGQSITIQAQRKNLASDTTTLTVNSGSGKPGLTQGSTVNGITTFTLNASDYAFGKGNTTYEFSGSDEFGSVFTDRISVSPVKKLDGISFNTTTNNQTFNATSQSSVSSLADSSGSVTFRIGAETIQHQQGLSTNNRFDIVGITGSGVTPTDTTPTKNEYSLSAFGSDSGSLTININYKDGSGDVTEHQQIVNYTKAIAGNIGADGTDGTDGTDGDDGAPGPPGPGVTYRGTWALNQEYVSSSLRRDVVQGSNGEYYLAKSSHTASNSNQQPTSGGSYTTYWDTFGATFSSVATDVLFSQDVYANRTVNVGSSGSGYPVIALNADTSNAGTNQNPYIAIGGITSYAASEGIYIGRHGGNSNVMSLKGGASDGFLTWDGSNLNIQGSINITGGATADSLSALNAETSSLQAGVTNSILSGSNAASGAAANASGSSNAFATSAASASAANASGSAIDSSTSLLNTSASALQGNIDTAQTTANTGVSNAATAQSTANTANTAATNAQSTANTANSTANTALTAAGASGSVDPTTGKLIKAISPSGAGLFLGADQLGYYANSSWTSYLSSSGDFELSGSSGFLQWNQGSSSLLVKGRISGSSIEGGTLVGSTLSIPNATTPKFSVDVNGNMACQDATISGSINVDDGIVGLWHVIESGSGGFLQNSDVSASIIMNPTTPEMLFLTSSATNVLETKIKIKPQNEWTDPSSANLNVTGMDVTALTPTHLTVSTNTFTYGDYQEETLTTGTTTVAQDGTFQLDIRQPYNLHWNNAPNSQTQTGTVNYPNYSPSYAYQQHPAWGATNNGATWYCYHYLEAHETTTDEVTRVQLAVTSYRGQYARSNYYQAIDGGGTLYWQFQTGGTQSSYESGNITNSAASLTGKSITLVAGTYKFKYSIRIAAQGGVYYDVDSSGNSTPNYVSTTTSNLDYSYLGYQNNYFNIIVPTNIIELTSKGLQILNDSDTYVQVNRLGSGFGSQPVLMKIFGGSLDIDGDAASTQPDLTAKYISVSTGSFSRITSFGYSGGGVSSTGGVSTTIYPRVDNTYDLGGSTSDRWDDVYASNGSIQTSDRNQKENITGSNLGLAFINDIEAVKYNFISGSRTHYGVIAQQVSESLASSSVHTDDFAGYIEDSLYTSGGMDFDKRYILRQGWDLNDFTISKTSYGLRYNELISPMIKAIQELTVRIEQLENE